MRWYSTVTQNPENKIILEIFAKPHFVFEKKKRNDDYILFLNFL